MINGSPIVFGGFGELFVQVRAEQRDRRPKSLHPYPLSARALIWLGCGFGAWGGLAGLGWGLAALVRLLTR